MRRVLAEIRAAERPLSSGIPGGQVSSSAKADDPVFREVCWFSSDPSEYWISAYAGYDSRNVAYAGKFKRLLCPDKDRPNWD